MPRNLDKVIEFMDGRYSVLENHGWRKDYVKKNFIMDMMFDDVSDYEIVQWHLEAAHSNLGKPPLSTDVLYQMGFKKNKAAKFCKLLNCGNMDKTCMMPALIKCVWSLGKKRWTHVQPTE